ncbi:MAG: DUF3465 domain-containing protein [bacterium]|nr:DUF3465 domain-containing protein [bacterium]
MLITPEKAFEKNLRDIFITTDGTVVEVMPDDLNGVKHQRFLILTASRHSLLIIYNIDSNPRLNISVGDKIHVEGTYVWNRYGGIIHETHSDIHKDQPDGGIVIQPKV